MDAGSRKPAARVLMVMTFFVGAGLAFILTRALVPGSSPSTASVLHYKRLPPERASDDAPAAAPERLLAWKQAKYDGSVSVDIVEDLLATGAAEALELRLTAAARADLDAFLRGHDEQLEAVASMAHEEGQFVKRRLCQRADRQLVIVGNSEELAARRRELVALRESVESSGKGVIWGDFDEQKREVHYIIKWEEWPILHQLTLDRAHMIVERKRLVRDWIGSKFAADGLAMFEG